MLLRIFKQMIYLTGKQRPVRGVTVLCYHSIGDGHSTINLPPEKFRDQMLWLRRRGIRFLSAKDFKDCLKTGVIPQQPSVLVSFDDGFRDNLYNALPIMRSLDIPGIVFLTTDYMGDRAGWISRKVFDRLPVNPGEYSGRLNRDQLERIRSAAFVRRNMPYLCRFSDDALRAFLTDFKMVARQPMLSWKEVRFMKNHGVSFGAHSRSHPFLTELSEAEIMSEITGSRAIIEEMTGDSVDFFCYPYSASSERVQRVLSAAGYLGAFTGGQVTCDRLDDRFAIRRVSVARDVPSWEFKFYFSRGFNWYATVRDRVKTGVATGALKQGGIGGRARNRLRALTHKG